MISVQEAERIINEKHFECGKVVVPLHDAVGRVLAEDVVADRDLPPFNRATMDGIAIFFQAYANGVRQFAVKGVQAAGTPPLTIESIQQCVEIMTGGVVPA